MPQTFYSLYNSPVGCLTLASDGKNLVGLWIENQKYFAASISGSMVRQDNLKIFADTKNWLDRYFAGEKPLISEISLAPAGSAFRHAVWQILCQIPYGEVRTYGQIATEIALQMNKTGMSAQAVGGAVGHNPISIIIPCHRVVGSNGKLTGYAAGLDVKIKLLRHENAALTGLRV